MNKRILASLIVIGFVAAGLGSTTMAMFNDSETSEDNKFTAGELDLQIDWEESYNGEHIETQELTDNPGKIFNLQDIKPGDHGEATVSLHLEDNPGWVWMNFNQTANMENGCTEPESEVDDTCGDPGHGEGELGEHLEFTIWADDGDNVKQEDEKVIFHGTAEELEEESLNEGVLLDGNPSTDETEAFPGGETSYIGIKWEVPLETGNEIQGDSKKFDIGFYTEQRRHNDNPENPWDSDKDKDKDKDKDDKDKVDNKTEETYYQVDFVGGKPIEDLGESTYSSEGRMQRYMHGGPDNPVDNESEPDMVKTGTGGPDCVDSEPFEVDTEKNTATVDFKVNNITPECATGTKLSLVSYEKDHPGWNPEKASEQELFDYKTKRFDPGHHTMTIDIPDVNEDAEAPEEPAPSGDLTFNDQMVNEDGEVTINNVSTNVDSTIFVTYEDGDDTVIAGVHNAPADLDNFDPMTVDIDESGVPGEYTARMIEKPIAIGYSTGDVLQDSTMEKQYFSQSAHISEAEEQEAEYTATQGDETVEITPIEGDEPVEEFYDFRLPDNYDTQANRDSSNGASYGSGPYYGSAGTEDLQQGDTSLMFLYEGPEGLSFVVVHEGEGSEDGGSATFEITDLDDSGEWVVKDDYYLDDDGDIASNNYDRWNTDSNPQVIDWTWGNGGSDGGAYTLSDDFEFTIHPAFNEEADLYDDNFYDGEVDEWQVVSGNRNNPDRTTLNMTEEVTIAAN